LDRGPILVQFSRCSEGVTHSSRFSVNFGFYSRSFLPPFEHFLRENWTRIELEIDSKLATVSNPNVLVLTYARDNCSIEDVLACAFGIEEDD